MGRKPSKTDLEEYSELTLIKALPESCLLLKDSGLYSVWDYEDFSDALDWGDEVKPMEEQKADESLKKMLVRFYDSIMDEDILIDLANEHYNEQKQLQNEEQKENN